MNCNCKRIFFYILYFSVFLQNQVFCDVEASSQPKRTIWDHILNSEVENDDIDFDSQEEDYDRKTSKTILIIGGVVGGLIVLLILSAIICMCLGLCCFKRAKTKLRSNSAQRIVVTAPLAYENSGVSRSSFSRQSRPEIHMVPVATPQASTGVAVYPKQMTTFAEITPSFNRDNNNGTQGPSNSLTREPPPPYHSIVQPTNPFHIGWQLPGSSNSKSPLQPDNTIPEVPNFHPTAPPYDLNPDIGGSHNQY